MDYSLTANNPGYRKQYNMGSKVLVVDDEPSITKTLGARLKAEGFEVMVAGDGITALHSVYKDPPDLIILDIMMPEMDGFETCQRLRSDPRYKEIPILMLTAKTAEEDKLWGEMLGAIEYLSKPFGSKELVEKVKKLIK